MNQYRLHTIINDCTTQFRHGDVVSQKHVGSVTVTTVDYMPHTSEAPDTLEKVDVHFMTVGVDRARAEAHRVELIEILDRYPEHRLADGPSYIEVGGVIGDQGAALRLFALGQVLGFWTVITPATLGITGVDGDKLAGMGMVMTSGYKPDAIAKK